MKIASARTMVTLQYWLKALKSLVSYNQSSWYEIHRAEQCSLLEVAVLKHFIVSVERRYCTELISFGVRRVMMIKVDYDCKQWSLRKIYVDKTYIGQKS